MGYYQKDKSEKTSQQEALELLDHRIKALTVQMEQALTIAQALELNTQLNNQLIRRTALYSRLYPQKSDQMVYNVKIIQ